MIIKKFLSKVKINNYTLILLFLSLITGLFKEIAVIFSLIIIHEFGHYIMMEKYNFNVKEISIYPFGGITKLEDVIDKPLKEELYVTMMGPIFQELLFIVIVILYNKNILSEYIFELYKNYNFSILLFNLLPIIPLDGSKIVNIILNKYFNFRVSYITNIIISIIVLTIFLIIYKLDNSYYVIVIFLIFQIIYQLKNKNIVYNKFLLERRLYKNKYIDYKKINKIDRMFRNKRHLIKDKNMYISENKYLKKYKF